MNHNMTLKFNACSENEAFARITIAAFCINNDPTIEILNDIKTAISEAVTNCIVHGYGNKQNGEILIEAEVCDDVLKVKISDYGKGIVSVEDALVDFYTTEVNGERSGLGFTIMKTFMDSLVVESSLGCGTVVTMTKKLA